MSDSGGLEIGFDQAFEALTGKGPLSWQRRLYIEHFATGRLPNVVDIPTGLGKTMVMALWLIARAKCPAAKMPTRLVYVVDRRTVVDQASDLVEEFAFLLAPNRKQEHARTLQQLAQGLKLGDGRLAVSTLRGQLADNREWSRDPSKPAIIIGTVDLIGSGLLFSGYRSSFKRRPLEAGLLGQDSLLVLDEAHLSKPFEKLICAISDKGKFQKDRENTRRGKPMQVIRMSATSGQAVARDLPFALQIDRQGDLTEEDAQDETVIARFAAKKTVRVVETDKVIESIATQADNLATERAGSRIVIFVQTPKQVTDVRRALERKNKNYAVRIAQLTGTMRGLERDELVAPPTQDDQHERRVMQRFLEPDNDSSLGACFLVSTSAGEVGFDLNGDHLVGDEAPLDSWIQRLGRVNRRGSEAATVILVKEKESADKTDFDRACTAASKLLVDAMDVSPKALATFKKSLTPAQIDAASSPEPAMVELTDILMDAWSMTSIVEPMPGRPPVEPWLRGIDEDLPHTTIAWRAELDLDGFATLDLDEVEEWFDTHRILTHETLSEKTANAAGWLRERWDKLSESQQSELRERPVVIDRAGLELIPLGELISRLRRKTDSFLRGAELIVPASFGGIRRGVGLLDPAEPSLDKDEQKKSLEERDTILKAGRDSIDVADAHGGRYREVEETEAGETRCTPLDSQASKPRRDRFARFAIVITSDDETKTRLISYVPRRERQESGSASQTLIQHVGAVRKTADQILTRLSADHEIEPTIKRAAQLAAEWHDHGKNREFFQRAVGGRPAQTVRQWESQRELDGDGSDQCLGKSGGENHGRPPRGYRHEFGSLRELTDAFNGGELAKAGITADVFDLAAHMTGSHHGRNRPHFAKGGFDPDCEARSDAIHTESVRRFARLQRKYGWWYLAWLENLLRCADAMASADQDLVDATDDGKGDAA